MNTTTSRSGHPDPGELLSLLADETLEPASEARLHLDTCPECQSQLERLAADPGLWKQASTLIDDARLGETVVLGLEDAPRWTDLQPARSDAAEEDRLVESLQLQSLLDQPSHPEMLGRLGHYDIEREIGRGGMGIVLKAFDTELNRPVAIKIMSPMLAGRGAAREGFAREARAAAAILHPNVIAIHGVSVSGRLPWLVMPYIMGPSLEQIVESNGPLAERDIVRFSLQIAAGLAAAHTQGVIHRDIKPANILIENGVGRVIITDFGLARAESDVSMTQTGWFAGTPAFMSPEQAMGRDLDARSDLFSLGSVMYYMATGRVPFRAEQPMAILERIRTENPRPARAVNSEISQPLSNLIDRLLAKNPGDRIQSAAALQQILENYLAHLQQPTRVRQPGFPAARGWRSAAVRSAMLAAAACGLVGATVLLWLKLGWPADSGMNPEARYRSLAEQYGLVAEQAFVQRVAAVEARLSGAAQLMQSNRDPLDWRQIRFEMDLAGLAEAIQRLDEALKNDTFTGF